MAPVSHAGPADVVEFQALEGKRVARRATLSAFGPRLIGFGWGSLDGVEGQIIAGGQRVLRNASFVIIETSIGRQDLSRRAALKFRPWEYSEGKVHKPPRMG